ncbi:MAG: D-Ala-D-Ala carboxypeptidase family metallohydrolase [Bacteroidota bacterium]
MNNTRVLDYWFRYTFDLTHPQKTVTSENQIMDILSKFKTTKYDQIDERYKSYTKSDQQRYKKLLERQQYYEIGRKDFYRYIVDDFRIEDFLCKDQFYFEALKDKSKTYYWLIDKEVLINLLRLQKELERKGCNKNGFTITNGHRHPRYNEKVGGAKLSRHIQGEAIDLYIQDIDNSGHYSKKDKAIVLKLLEDIIIKDKGGIGLYPGTRVVHFDVRGYRARWNTY